MKQLLFTALLLASICPMNYGMQQVAIKPPVQAGTYFTPRKIVGGVIIGAIGALVYVVQRYKAEQKAIIEDRLRNFASVGDFDLVNKLLERAHKCGADINAADKHGNTALMYAIKGQYVPIIQLLSEHGAGILFDPSDKRAKGISLVLDTHNVEIVTIFAKWSDERQRLKLAAEGIMDPAWRKAVNNIIAKAEAEANKPLCGYSIVN